jgi:wobble nucleotide-excising tRNase
MVVPANDASNQYQIKRKDGTLAEHTLSEGEITFLTFLYFLQLTKGGLSQETVSSERVVVIDDPISSLDSSVLFVVSSLLKNLMDDIRAKKGNIKQLILFTHNVYFHKEVSFFNGRIKERTDTHFWILRKTNNISTVEAYKTTNPIKNSYELLWRELQNSTNNSSCITIQNIMRRIIEEYFKTLGGYSDESILDKFENQEEKEVCRSLICWINDGSHCITDSLFIEQPNEVIERYNNVFKSIFITLGHEAHYNMMMHMEDYNNVNN